MRPGSGQRATETLLNPARAPGSRVAWPEPLPPAEPPPQRASRPAAQPARLPEPRSAVTWALGGDRPELGSRHCPPGPFPSTLPCISWEGPNGLGRRFLKSLPRSAGLVLPTASP